jgi:hypothetical protein
MTRSTGLGVSFPLALAAGIGAGAAAGLVNVGLLVLLQARNPPVMGTGGSSVAAGILGGAVYWAWSRISPRPAAALWLTSLLVATIDTIVIFTLPFPTAGRHIHVAALAGIVTPLLQILALFGIGGSSPGRMPTTFLGIYLEVHYVTAAVVSLLTPVFARPKSG